MCADEGIAMWFLKTVIRWLNRQDEAFALRVRSSNVGLSRKDAEHGFVQHARTQVLGRGQDLREHAIASAAKPPANKDSARNVSQRSDYDVSLQKPLPLSRAG
jgi:hypothetical protein